MGAWPKDAKTHVSHMTHGDFYATEKSVSIPKATTVRIEHVDAQGKVTVLLPKLKLQANEVLDASVLSVKALREFFEKEITDAKNQDVLLSLHLKATMMKVSDPIIFGHAVEVYFKDFFAKHAATVAEIGASSRNGLGDIYENLSKLPENRRKEVISDIEACYKSRPRLAMVNSAKVRPFLARYPSTVLFPR